MNNAIDKILVIRLSSLGDILLTTPVIRALRSKYPNAKIDFLCREEYSSVVLWNRYLNDKIIYDNSSELISELKNRNYEVVIDLQNNLRSRKITKELNAIIYRYKKPTVKKFLIVNFRWNLLAPPVSIVERYAGAVDNLELDDGGLNLFLPKNIKSILTGKRKYVGICPGSRHFTKQYPVEYQIELCRKLSGEGFSPVLFGGKSDIEICAEIERGADSVINLSNDNDLYSTAANMKKCSVVICNDSGLMHTAAAMKVPVIAIFGSTVKEFGFAPYGVKNVIIENEEISCRPCSHIGKSRCPKGHFDCMRSLTPEIVLEKFKNFYESVI